MKRRIWKIVFLVFSLVGLAASVVFNRLMQEMACAFSGPGTRDCTYRWPWEFRFEEALLLGLPFCVFAVLSVWALLLISR